MVTSALGNHRLVNLHRSSLSSISFARCRFDVSSVFSDLLPFYIQLYIIQRRMLHVNAEPHYHFADNPTSFDIN